MGYQPIQVNPRSSIRRSTTLMAKGGVNNRDLPQLLDVKFAQKIVNYLAESDGRLIKRKGLEKILEVAGTVGITLFKKFDDDTFIFGYGTTIARYTVSTDTVTNIKTNFSANSGFDGVRYGVNFFVCNGVDKIWRITAAYAISEITASPVCSVLSVIGNRIYAGRLSTDETAVQYSMVDDGSTTPFGTWTIGTDATDSGTVRYRNGGKVNSIVPLGQFVVILQDKGRNVFYLDTIDSSGTLTKVERFQEAKIDFGGARGAIATNEGIFYLNEAGLWRLMVVGQTDAPRSGQEVLVTELLGDQFFSDVDLAQCDIAYDAKKRNIISTFAKNSDSNNSVLVYNLDLQSITTVTGWNINRFYNDDQLIYGASSVAIKVYKTFTGVSDDGLSIGTEYLQELNVGQLETKKYLKGLYVQGFLSASSSITIKFDIFDIDGVPVTDKIKFTWTPQYSLSGFDGYNSAQYNASAYGGDVDNANLIECFDGIRPVIRNFQRVRVHITSGDKLDHQINWLSIEAQEKKNIRRRKLTLLT